MARRQGCRRTLRNGDENTDPPLEKKDTTGKAAGTAAGVPECCPLYTPLRPPGTVLFAGFPLRRRAARPAPPTSTVRVARPGGVDGGWERTRSPSCQV